MNELMDFFSDNYYTSLLLLVTGIIAIPISIKHRKKFPILKFIPIYLGFSVFQCLFNCLLMINWNTDQRNWLYITNDYIIFLFLIIEVSILGSVLKLSIVNSFIKKSIELFIILFSLFIAILAFFHHAPDVKLFTIASFVEMGFLIIPCAFYYYEILSKNPHYNPSVEPSFWVITGLTIFLVTTFPYTLIQGYIIANELNLAIKLQALIYISYCLLFILIIKAYMCKTFEATRRLNTEL